MRKELELSDKIRELFQLQPGQFDPLTHLPLAEQLVKEFGGSAYLFHTTDIFSWSGPSLRLEAEGQSAGYYLITPKGRLSGAATSGFYPKLRIVHWWERVVRDIPHEFEDIEISYEGSEVKVVEKSLRKPLVVSFSLGRADFKFSYYTSQEIWVYHT